MKRKTIDLEKIKEVKRSSMTLAQMKRALRKKQDILCADNKVHTLWLSLALEMLTHGDTVQATVYSPEGVPTPKKKPVPAPKHGLKLVKKVSNHNKAVGQVAAALMNKK